MAVIPKRPMGVCPMHKDHIALGVCPMHKDRIAMGGCPMHNNPEPQLSDLVAAGPRVRRSLVVRRRARLTV